MSIHGLPLILFNVGRKKLSDIEYLSIKEFDNKLRNDEGLLSATGTLATLTANTGQDMYIARAQVVFFINAGGANTSFADAVELRINGTVVETATSSFGVFSGSGVGGNSVLVYDFKNIGHSVAAGQIINLEVTTLSSVVDVEGFIECFEEPTGTTPQV